MPSEAAPESKTVSQLTEGHKDWFLIILIDLVQQNGFEIGMTFTSSGIIVSGFLSSGDRYFRDFGKELADGFGNKPEYDDITSGIASFGGVYTESKNLAETNPSYVHVRDARFFTPGQKPIPGNKGIWWRAKISSVDGFSIGTLSAS